MPNYIFDLDGTLVNSAQEVLNCLKKAFLKANYYVSEEKFNYRLIGPPLKEIIKRIAPELKDENKINEILVCFREIYDYLKNDSSYLYDGVLEILNFLKNKNNKLFLATLKPIIPTQRIIKKFELNYFNEVYSIDKFNRIITKEEMIKEILDKYSLNKNETLMIGDTSNDIIAGKKNGIISVLALWGYGGDKSLIHMADYSLNNILAIKQLKVGEYSV